MWKYVKGKNTEFIKVKLKRNKLKPNDQMSIKNFRNDLICFWGILKTHWFLYLSCYSGTPPYLSVSSQINVNQWEERSELKLTNQELELEVVGRQHRAVEGHSNDELLATAHHQVLDVVGGGVVVGFVDGLTHVNAVHRQCI